MNKFWKQLGAVIGVLVLALVLVVVFVPCGTEAASITNIFPQINGDGTTNGIITNVWVTPYSGQSGGVTRYLLTNIFANGTVTITNVVPFVASTAGVYAYGSAVMIGSPAVQLGFYGTAPVSQQTAITVTNLSTAGADGTNLAVQINALITQLKALGIVK